MMTKMRLPSPHLDDRKKPAMIIEVAITVESSLEGEF